MESEEGRLAPRVKICGLCRREDVLVADDAGANYVGVVLTSGFSRTVEPAEASALVLGVRATRVAVLVDEAVPGAVTRAEALGAGVLQLHGSEPPEVVRELAEARRWRLWKSVRVRVPDDVDRAVELYAPWVDGFLVEGWQEGVVGGGGMRLDAERVGDLRGRIPEGLEVILAGGLNPDNVAAAVARFGPDVVDVSSGVETEPRRKSHDRIRLFVRRARADGPAADEDGDTTASRRELLS